MEISTLLIATNNAHKITEFRRLLSNLGLSIVTPADQDLYLDVDESGITFEDNARLKARAFCEASGLPSLADDSGIEVDALEGRPGVYSARYGGDLLDDEGKVRLLLAEMDEIPDRQRTCHYRVALVLAWPDGTENVAEGVCTGTLGREPLGLNGFGYDPVFRIPRFGKTIAELAPEQKDAISHRGQAVRLMADTLSRISGTEATP
jgi:XTP/dITP diphosphohydrolase